jgi:hypothetical protein
MVYFIQSMANDLIKIGYSSRVSCRRQELSYIMGVELVLLGVIDGTRKDETVLHKRFSDLRTKGEWFCPADELLSFIDQNARPYNDTSERSRKARSFSIKGNIEWFSWLDEYAVSCGMNCRASLVDRALVELARFVGFKRPAPPRFKAK